MSSANRSRPSERQRQTIATTDPDATVLNITSGPHAPRIRMTIAATITSITTRPTATFRGRSAAPTNAVWATGNATLRTHGLTQCATVSAAQETENAHARTQNARSGSSWRHRSHASHASGTRPIQCAISA